MPATARLDLELRTHLPRRYSRVHTPAGRHDPVLLQCRRVSSSRNIGIELGLRSVVELEHGVARGRAPAAWLRSRSSRADQLAAAECSRRSRRPVTAGSTAAAAGASRAAIAVPGFAERRSAAATGSRQRRGRCAVAVGDAVTGLPAMHRRRSARWADRRRFRSELRCRYARADPRSFDDCTEFQKREVERPFVEAWGRG